MTTFTYSDNSFSTSSHTTITPSSYSGDVPQGQSLKSVVIGASVDIIGIAAFKSTSSLESITIPEGVTRIETDAFNRASSLTSIDLPSTLTYISHHAFQNATSLTSIDLPGVEYIGWNAFFDASGLTSITIPSVTIIRSSTFSGTTSLTSITIPSSVDIIGTHVFQYSGLESITIPEGTTSIGKRVFRSAESLSSITIPSSVTSIGEYAFEDASSLTSITLPSTLTSISSNAFEGSGLGNVYIADIDTFNNNNGDTTTFGYGDNVDFYGATVTIAAAASTVVEDATSTICFLGDSMVKTDQGEFPIENLEFETLHGERFVRTKTKFLGDYLVVIEKDSLGNQVPNKKTVITPEHKVFINGVMTEARKLINNDTIYKCKYKGEYVYNILQEEHSDMYVNNMLCETLNPYNSIRKLYTKNATNEDIIEYNKTIKSLLR